MRILTIISCVLMLVAGSCSNDPTGLECIEIVYPTSEILWYYMQSYTHVEWSGAEGEQVRMSIYRNGEYYVDYLDWTDNDGYAERSDYLHPACHGSGAYQIRIEDSRGNTGLSDFFTITCGGLGNIEITYPSGLPTWTFNGSDAYVTWENSSADTVRVHIYKGNGTYIGILIGETPNDGYAEPQFPLNPDLLPGSYYLQITDDQGEFGIGGDFYIQ